MKKASGKFVLRLDPELHQECRSIANRQRLSLNQYVVNVLSGRGGGEPLTAALREYFSDDLLGVIQFGSTVRGEQRETSDIDILIVMNQARPIDRSLYRIWDEDLSKNLDPRYSPQFSHLPDPSRGPSSLWLEVALEGEILIDSSDARAKKTLRQIREAIASGKYLRKISHGHPYWVRGEDENAE